MRGFLVLFTVLFVCLIASVVSHPFFVTLTRLQDPADQLMSKRGLDKCGCNLGCFYSSARDCMSCCALAL